MKFIYRAKTIKGEEKTGEIEATSKALAADLLRKENLFITALTEEKEKIVGVSFLDKIFKRISAKDKILFTQQLAVMIQSGFPIVRALKTLQKQTENKNLAHIIGELVEDVEGGVALSAALAKHPNIFPKIYVEVAKSGEKSGELDKVLLKLASDLEKSYDLMAKIRGAMVYPAFILLAIIGVVILVLVFVVPQLEIIFKEAGAALPLLTRLLIGMSKFIINFWWLAIIIIGGLIGLFNWIGKTPKGREFIDWLKLKIPIFGLLLKKVYLARFIRTLSTLTGAGLGVLDIFETLKDVVGNVHYKKDIEIARKKIESGSPIGLALSDSQYFPPMITQMITVGEQAGNLDYILGNLARFLEKDVSYMSKNLATLIEPVLMIIMGAGVGFIVGAVLMPIYNLVQAIK